MPYYGLSLHKPSILWPPPTNVESNTVRQTIRSRLRRVTGLDDQNRLKSFLGSRSRAQLSQDEPIISENVPSAGRKVVLDASASVPSVVEGQDQKIVLEADSGETLVADSQIQLYAPNNLLSHPLISHCGAYLGGLPPLFFIAGDQEVLRDEIIYTLVLSPPSPLRHSCALQSSPSSKSFQVPDPSRGQAALSKDHGDCSKTPHPDESSSPSLRRMRARLTHPLRVHNSRKILFPSDCKFLSIRDRDAVSECWNAFTHGRKRVGAVSTDEFFRRIIIHESTGGGWGSVTRE